MKEKEEKKISIIVPVFNVEKYLSTCIESLINQYYENVEIILVNDGSKDNSGKICNKYASQDERIKVIHKNNEGVSIARNSGIQAATGEYIAFVDGDDFVHKDIYTTLYNSIIDGNYDLGMCRFYRHFIDGSDVLEIEPLRNGIYERNTIFNELMLPMIGNDFNNMGKPLIMGAIWRCLYKRSIILENKIEFSTIKIAEDMLFHLKYLGYCNNVYIVDKPLYYYRYNAISATKNYITSLWETLNYQLELVKETLESFNLLNDISKERMKSNAIYFISWCFTNECHPSNPGNNKELLGKMRQIGKSDLFYDAFKWQNIILAPFKQRCIFICIKLKLYRMVYFYNNRKLKGFK